jgi:hypothetical protein
MGDSRYYQKLASFDMLSPDDVHQSNIYAICATHRQTGQRLLIKVSNLATREQLIEEIARMNRDVVVPTHKYRNRFIYSLTTEGITI